VRQGLLTVAGTSLAMIIQLGLAALSTANLLSLISDGLFWLKWFGVAYLAYLGASAITACITKKPNQSNITLGSFQRGFFVSLTNPKTLVFFVAFLPQFVSDGNNYSEQIIILSVTFWLIAITVDSSYVLIARVIEHVLTGRVAERWQNGLSGGLFLAASSQPQIVRLMRCHNVKCRAIKHEVSNDTCRVTKHNCPCPFQMTKERVDTSSLAHHSNAGSRAYG
jgi:homoserine/homoserine lactone efflux protein